MVRKLRSAPPTEEQLQLQRLAEEHEQQQRQQAQQQKKRLPSAGSRDDLARGASVDVQREDEDEEDDMSDFEVEDNRPPEREVSQERAQTDYATLHSMWEFAAIVEFLFTFRHFLNIQATISVDTLADALIRAPGARRPMGAHGQ
jgi:hypothetical protein